MNIKCLTRKRIWEVDCWSLDSAMAASFDWRELVNILQGHGHTFDLQKPVMLLELRAHSLMHEYCHSENEISLRLEHLLNEWHRRTLEAIDEMAPAEVAEYVLSSHFDQKACAAIFWALGSDARPGFDCIRRRFHQRAQIASARKISL